MLYTDDSIPCLVDYETREDCIVPAAHKLKEGMIAVELGSYLGGSVCLLASNLREPNIRVYAIDNWVCDNISQASLDWSKLEKHDQVYGQFIKNISERGFGDIIYPIKSDTAKAAIMFEDKSVNYLFMDAAHGYGGVKEELLAWLPKLADNAFCFIHDWPAECIRDAVYEVVGRENIKVVRGGSSVIIKDTL